MASKKGLSNILQALRAPWYVLDACVLLSLGARRRRSPCIDQASSWHSRFAPSPLTGKTVCSPRQTPTRALTPCIRSFLFPSTRAITGPVSSPDYLSHLSRAPEFRGVAPTSVPTRASVPYAEPDRVYDIKYFTRDMRRSDLNTKVTRRTWANDGAAGAKDASRTGGVYRWGQYKSILDVENDGFTA